MKEIKLTQYMMPNGRAQRVTTEVSDETAELAAGMILSCEVLQTGTVVFYAKYPNDKEEEEDIELSTNGPEVQSALAMLIKRKYEANQETKPAVPPATEIQGEESGCK